MLDSTETRKRPNLREVQKQYTRNQLMTVARKLFLKHGLDRTTIGDISDAAGTTRATFYAHFPSKESFISELWQDLWRDLCCLNTELSLAGMWRPAVVSGWIARVSETWREHAQSLGVTQAQPTVRFQSTLLEGLHREVDKLVMARQWDRFEPDEARRRCYLLLLQLHQSMEALHCRGWKVDANSLVASLTDIWLQTCAVDAIDA